MMDNIQPGNLSVLARLLGYEPYPISIVAVPVIAKRECLGVLVLQIYQGPCVFAAEDIRFDSAFTPETSLGTHFVQDLDEKRNRCLKFLIGDLF